MVKYSFKYNSNTSFRVIEATDDAGYDIAVVKDLYRDHLMNEIKDIAEMTNEEFIKYFGVK